MDLKDHLFTLFLLSKLGAHTQAPKQAPGPGSIFEELLKHSSNCETCADRETCESMPEPYKFDSFSAAEAHIKDMLAAKPGDTVLINTNNSAEKLYGVIIKVDLPLVTTLAWNKKRGFFVLDSGLDVVRLVGGGKE